MTSPPLAPSRLLSRLFSRPDGPAELVAGPIRGELLGAEHLAERARALAAGQRLAKRRRQRGEAPLLARLNGTRRLLDSAHTRLAAAAERQVDVGPAGEWLLDNFHVVDEHAREVLESLPRGYYRELPELASGTLAGYPRGYEVATTIISHTEGRIDIDNLDLFLSAFQQVTPLSIGELWSVPAMLRLALLENVRRMTLRTLQRLDDFERADHWAARISAAADLGTSELTTVLGEFTADKPSLTPVFVSRFLQQIRAVQGSFAALVWIEQWIAEDGMSAEDAAARTSQHLALTQVVMANSITSLRTIASMDWRLVVERHSVLDAALADDPSGFYQRMTFATRDQYRHVVEGIAKVTGHAEDAVAREALALAAAGARESPHALEQAHVGYYLVDAGLADLERATGFRPPLATRLYRWMLRHPNVVFVGGIVVGTVAALAAVFWLAGAVARTAWPLVILFALIPANEIAVSAMLRLLTAFLPPRTLPKLDLREGGVPPEFRTAVVVPTLFGSVEAVNEALENLEVQFLANREAHLHFAVLSDFTDAPAKADAADSAIVAAAADGIRALNARYAGGAADAFYLFHRPRRWNARQGVWMGWERKRGKLAEFNRFLRAGGEGAFTTIVGDVEVLRRVRYVVTLDADTVLPTDAAPLLIGAMAHPLNRAQYDEGRGRIVRGYGILQPRVGVSLPSAHRSRFAAVHSGHPGVDPYTTAVSDVYQDLYGEGSFTGKGIYDVDAFEQATHGRFPENTLLSHDLIEGNFARAGLATDIEVYDDYPTRYLTFARRKHRWIRGDWQLLGWLTPTVPGPDGPEPNRLSLLSRWKIFDNLRRSIVEIAQLAFLIAGWTVFPGSPLMWTALGLGAIAAPWIASLILAAVRPPLDKSWRAYYGAVGHDAATSVQQLVLAIGFLPHQAWISADAIARTLWRLFVSRRRLLEWQTASQAERMAVPDVGQTWRAMRSAVLVAAAVLVVVVTVALSSGASALRMWQLVAAAGPLLLMWMFSPLVAHRLNTPAVPRERRLSPDCRTKALRYAIMHWRFFERFVAAETKWLAPDNFQEEPAPTVAMRTSPTNIGLQLLATVSAYDLGLTTVDRMVEQLELAFRTMERLRRFRGHFYNWYDLHDLHVLEPAYISTVDSGNLAGHLIALRQACLSIPDEPVFDFRVKRVVDTTLGIALDRLDAMAEVDGGVGPTLREAIAVAAEQLRRAQSEAEPGIWSATDIDTVIAGLVGARQALGHAPGFEPIETAAGWIDWASRLLAEHRRRISGVEPALMPRRRGELTPIFPSLRALAATDTTASETVARLEALAHRAYQYALEMDFRFLFDNSRSLFAIGYQQSNHSRDGSYYDLLASEARLASFVAIAKNDVPAEHWFRLSRTLTRTVGETALVSWSGSMFEYLMPALVMQSFPFTVLDQTYQAAVRRQIAYGAERGVPWGVSESAYNVRDRHLTYQYRAFGVPDLALKRGLGRDLVVAPYASALAAMVNPEAALANLAVAERKGALGPFGFRDALDYTRPLPGQRYAVVGTYMAHHIGMGVIALANALTGGRWPRRFHADPLVRSAELLLHERIPRRLVLQAPQAARADEALPDAELERPAVREVDTAQTPQPHVALLGHLPYTIMVTSGGGGYSRYEGLAVTRWRADGTRDNTGQFHYVRDVARGRVWSAAHQPVCATPDWYRVALATDRVAFDRADGEIETRTEIAVVPADSAEVRRITVTNNGDEVRDIDLTSYGEIVLAPPDTDRAHPAFANLFVETEWHEWCSAITATRRPRSAQERSLWCVHVADTDRRRVGPTTCETDRARFIGRGRSTRDPLALESDGPLSGTTGAVIDPIFSLRTRIRLRPGQSASAAFTTLVADSRERAFELADRYHDPHAAQRALDLAWTAAQIELRELGITPADAAAYQAVAGHLFFSNEAVRAPRDELQRNRGSQPLLWGAGVSGDWPILLATIDSADGLPTLRQLFAAHHYWRRRGMMVDLVVLNAHPPTYSQELNDRIMAALFASREAGFVDQPGGVFIRRRDLLGGDIVPMLRATARVHVSCDGRSLGRILEKAGRAMEAGLASNAVPPSATILSGRRTPAPSSSHPRALTVAARDAGSGALRGLGRALRGVARRNTEPRHAVARPPLLFDNGFGGIDPAGAYEIRVAGDAVPPAPWANVIANPHGGFVVSERGSGFSWAKNSYFYRLTPWHNDPVSDPVGEALYLRDEETGDVWCPVPAPIRDGAPYTVRHRPGTSSFEHEHAEIATDLTLGLAEDAMVKLSLLRITNHGARTRRLTLTAYAEWTLGALREHTQHQVVTEFDAGLGAILARNFFNAEFATWTAFCAVSEPVASHTADRREFLGRNGSAAEPAGLEEENLAGATGAGLDPCAALRCVIDLAPGETYEVAVLLGAAASEGEARRLVTEYRDVGGARRATAQTVATWDERLSVVRVRTPEPAFDVMINHWALYQALACRMWARSAVYQSSGAYGFRDQLQDVAALVYAEPGIAREHIVRAAGRQFAEGDVQHWWHPQSGRGVRTRFSDDLVWLPYITDWYLRATGDATVLDEQVPFLTMRMLQPDEHEVYDLPEVSNDVGSVYEHCLRALRRACTEGPNGLPLIGIGDWNDGMNRVGVEGRGESVWLAWFLVATLRPFAEHAEMRGDTASAAEFRSRADSYVAAVESHGWDGEWYRRAYFDDGTPLGSAGNDECRIDSIAQSWSVISGAADPTRRTTAMRSLERHLVRENDRLIALLTPPFDEMPNDPGYIKGYLPGVRENGAQYTHAALWVVLATALLGDGDRAFKLFQMINPLMHARTQKEVETYKVEPYVVAADVYTAPGQLGRGGWTWYTGSASWMYRVGLEAILGFNKRGQALFIDPCVPAAWPEYTIEYRYGGSTYVIAVLNPGGVDGGLVEVSLDGEILATPMIPLVDDGAPHEVVVRPAVPVSKESVEA